MRAIAAVVERKEGPFELCEVDLPQPENTEVMIDIVGVGLCHTDVVAQNGHLPVTLPAVFGHEGAGIVRATGPDVKKVKVGDQVAMTFMSCGQCNSCSGGAPAYCHSMTKLNFLGRRSDGSQSLKRQGEPVSGNFFNQSSFATHAIADERNVVKVPDGMALDIAGTLGCGMQTGAGAILRSLDCVPGSTLLVIGGGTVGLAAVMAGKIRELDRIIVAEPYAARRDLALELGATHAVCPVNGAPLSEQVKEICPGGVDTILDTTGLPHVVGMVPDMLATRGQFGFVGTPPAGHFDMKLPGDLVNAMLKGWAFRGIIEGDSDIDGFLEELMQLHIEGRFPFDRLITRYPLTKINEAVADQKAGRCVKPVLIPGD